MKLIFKITLPAEPFNALARKGMVGNKIKAILEATKPESIYFTGNESGRGAIAVYEVSDGSQVPSLGEPWFMTFDAKIEYSVAISPEEMAKANLDEVIKKWA
ncbi:MAG TPA: panthothenate synthetase [Terriglobia bacterium]|nr:panthothenate synthetase [Terriglobia bacterium]